MANAFASNNNMSFMESVLNALQALSTTTSNLSVHLSVTNILSIEMDDAFVSMVTIPLVKNA